MRTIAIVAAAVALAGTAPGEPGAPGSVLPYRIEKRTLPNRLDVLVVETPEFKEVLAFDVLILAGSRNEVERGRSGLAHLFEHMAFRHRFGDPGGSYVERMEKMGSHDNGWTWFDVTCYTPETFARNLDELAKLQGERFSAMDFTEAIYRTETGAVLGEYRKAASDPSLRMEEVGADLLYGKEHGYGHTTMGYLADVEDMPNSYPSGKAFYETWYRPNNAVVVVAGDVRAPEVFAAVEKTFGGWKPGDLPALPRAMPAGGPKRGQVDWDSDIPPRISFSYRVPSFRPEETDAAALLLMPELLAGRTAPLFRKLRYEKRTATSFGIDLRSAQGFDSRPLEASARVDKERYDRDGRKVLDDIEADLRAGFEELKGFSKRPDGAATLASFQAKHRYDLMAALDSPPSIAGTLAWYYRFGRDERILDRLVEAVDRLRPEDIDAFAARHFVPENLAVVTMTPKAKAPGN